MKNEPWKEYPHIWKTQSAFMSFLRGGIRRSLWNRHPVKLEFIKNNRIKIPNPNPRGRVKEVWGGVCALTGEVCVIGDLQIDHIEGNHSLKDISDIQSFVEGIVLIKESDLQFVSTSAHKVKSYADKHNMTFEEALLEQKVIEFGKLKSDKQIEELSRLGLSGKNASERKEVYRNYLKGE